ncbi:uncharacterized protein LOC131243704 [Magnolia sinica]|uniref:uncharacterized protein LOC131243704 n=1 Tax=Magnolia sinica TaxID=86752 RepID=UPI002658EAD1|nr:uncharacterized protein LOC131243704 [Magnolia sinica]
MREISSSSCRCDGSSTIATVDEIQRRLHRPIPPPPSSRPSFSTDIKLHDSIEKERDSEKKKLEDYLDPILLSAISSKMKGNRRNGEKKRKRDAEFEWPTEDLRVFFEDARSEWIDGAVSLDDDLETTVKEDGGSGSPFRRFEETVLTLFNKG